MSRQMIARMLLCENSPIHDMNRTSMAAFLDESLTFWMRALKSSPPLPPASCPDGPAAAAAAAAGSFFFLLAGTRGTNFGCMGDGCRISARVSTCAHVQEMSAGTVMQSVLHGCQYAAWQLILLSGQPPLLLLTKRCLKLRSKALRPQTRPDGHRRQRRRCLQCAAHLTR